MLIFYVFAILAGVATAIQPGQNAQLSESIEWPLLAGAISLFVSLLTVLAVLLVSGQPGLPSAEILGQVPWWAWFGGVFSATLSVAQLYISKRIGAAPFLGLIVTAGVVTSILLDNYGLVGFKAHPASVGRLIGGALMIAGVGFVARF